MRFEPLEDRSLLSVTVAIGAPVLIVLDDPTATASTTFQVGNVSSSVNASILNTTHLLKMQVHTVNTDGSTGTSGEMDFLLLDDYAPKNIEHITELASEGFYDGLTFHRVIEDFMIQGGDPRGTGTGGSGANGAAGDVQDDEFNADIRFTSSGLLALANSGTDTNDCQFFITATTFRGGDYQYVILGKLVAGDDIRQAIASVDVEENDSGETSAPVNSPIIDSMSIVTNTEYGLMMLKATDTAEDGDSAMVPFDSTDKTAVYATDDDGEQVKLILNVDVTADTPSTYDRPAFIESLSDVHTTMNTPVTFSVPVVEGDAGVGLTYAAGNTSDSTNLVATASGTDATDGTVTLTPSNDIVGVYRFGVAVGRTTTDGSYNPDVQYAALYIKPVAPTALSVTTSGVADGGTTTLTSGFTFHVTGVTTGLTVAIFVDGGTTPIGTTVATSDTVDITTTGSLLNGSHTFTVMQSTHYDAMEVGNRMIAAGDLCSDVAASTVTITVAAAPTPNPSKWLAPPTVNADYASTTMTAATATANDASVAVQYYFHCLTTGGHDSGWQTSSTYTDTGLAYGVYVYQVKTRDSSSYIETTYSASASVKIVDEVPPTPNPSIWAVAPYTTGSTSIKMVAATATDVNGVQYYFRCLTTGGHDSGWQDSPTYEDTGLTAGTIYAYEVKTRDLSPAQNVGSFSAAMPATTQKRVSTAPAASVTGVIAMAASPTDHVISYRLADEESDACGVLVQYSTDGGATWRKATRSTGGEGISSLASSVDGTDHTFVWDSLTDLGSVDCPSVVIRVTPSDADSGSPALSDIFAVDNAAYAQRFTLTSPTTGSYGTGQSISIQWTADNVRSGSVISLCYDKDTTWNNGNEYWIEIDRAKAADGSGSFTWDTTNVQPGTYYVAGYLYDGRGNFTLSHLTQSTTIAKAPIFALTSSASGTFVAGQTVPIRWNTANLPANSKISLCYDQDTTWNNGNEHWIEIDQIAAANGTGYYNWKTTGLAAGTYYVAGYVFGGDGSFTLSHLTQPLTIVTAPQVFTLSGPTSQTFVAGQDLAIQWTASNVVPGSKISLCYDKDNVWNNGNETWIEIDGVAAANGSGSYTWDHADVAPGTYYIAGYLYNGANGFTLSHLAQTITIAETPRTFALTSPTSGTYLKGQTVDIQWQAGNVVPGSKVSLCYDTDDTFNGNERWIEIDKVVTDNGPISYTWNTANVPTGTYYLAGYMWDGANGFTISHLKQSISIGAALTLSTSSALPASLPETAVLNSTADLTSLVDEAMRRLSASSVSGLDGVSFEIADLPGELLAETIGKTIVIDRDAAGHGWFVDSTPADDAEYADLLNAHALAAADGSPAALRADLLTTVMHEMEHVLGHDDSAAVDLLNPTLPLGMRRLA